MYTQKGGRITPPPSLLFFRHPYLVLNFVFIPYLSIFFLPRVFLHREGKPSPLSPNSATFCMGFPATQIHLFLTVLCFFVLLQSSFYFLRLLMSHITSIIAYTPAIIKNIVPPMLRSVATKMIPLAINRNQQNFFLFIYSQMGRRIVRLFRGSSLFSCSSCPSVHLLSIIQLCTH